MFRIPKNERTRLLLLFDLLLLLAISIFFPLLFAAAIPVLFAIFVAFFAFRRPKAALLLHVFLIPFVGFIPELSLTSLVSFDTLLELLLAAFVFWNFVSKKKRLFECRQNAVVALFFSVAIFSSMFAANLGESIFALVSLAHSILLFFLVSNLVESKQDIRNIFLVLVLSGVVASFYSICQLFAGEFAKGTIPGIFGENNATAGFLVVLVPIAVFLVFSVKRLFIRLLSTCSAFLLLLGIVISFSRSSLLSLAAVFLLQFPKLREKKKAVLSLIVLFLVVFSLVPLPFVYSALTSAGLTPSTKRALDIALVDRVSLNIQSAEIFLENFFVGVGVGNFPEFFLGRAKLTDFAWNADKSPHNLYLLVAAELGILGLLLFALLLFFTFKDLCFEKNLPLLSFGNILLAVLLVFLIEGFFRNHLYLHVFWIVLALAPVLRKKGLY